MRRYKKLNVDEALDGVLRDLQKSMEQHLGKVSLAETQRMLAYQIRNFGLHNFEKKRRTNDSFFK